MFRPRVSVWRVCAVLTLNGSDEAVSSPRQSFHKTRALGRVSQYLADLLDGGVDAVLEVYESVGRPEPFLNLFSGDHLSRAFEKHRQDLKWLACQLEFQPALVQIAGAKIGLEESEANDLLPELLLHVGPLTLLRWTLSRFCRA